MEQISPDIIERSVQSVGSAVCSVEVKFVIFSKKLLCKVPIFFIHRLGSRKVYQNEKKKVGVGVVIKKK
jgi:hypothetical protein